jgi:hypothetical protein
MEPEDSLPLSHDPAFCSYLEPDKSFPCPTSHFKKSHFNNILRLNIGRVISFPHVSPPKPCMHPSSSPYALHASPISFFLIWSTEWYLVSQYRSLSPSPCSLLPPSVTYSLLGPNILLSTLFSNTLSLHSSLNVNDQVSHPYQKTGQN